MRKCLKSPSQAARHLERVCNATVKSRHWYPALLPCKSCFNCPNLNQLKVGFIFIWGCTEARRGLRTSLSHTAGNDRV